MNPGNFFSHLGAVFSIIAPPQYNGKQGVNTLPADAQALESPTSQPLTARDNVQYHKVSRLLNLQQTVSEKLENLVNIFEDRYSAGKNTDSLPSYRQGVKLPRKETTEGTEKSQLPTSVWKAMQSKKYPELKPLKLPEDRSSHPSIEPGNGKKGKTEASLKFSHPKLQPPPTSEQPAKSQILKDSAFLQKFTPKSEVPGGQKSAAPKTETPDTSLKFKLPETKPESFVSQKSATPKTETPDMSMKFKLPETKPESFVSQKSATPKTETPDTSLKFKLPETKPEFSTGQKSATPKTETPDMSMKNIQLGVTIQDQEKSEPRLSRAVTFEAEPELQHEELPLPGKQAVAFQSGEIPESLVEVMKKPRAKEAAAEKSPEQKSKTESAGRKDQPAYAPKTQDMPKFVRSMGSMFAKQEESASRLEPGKDIPKTLEESILDKAAVSRRESRSAELKAEQPEQQKFQERTRTAAQVIFSESKAIKKEIKTEPPASFLIPEEQEEKPASKQKQQPQAEDLKEELPPTLLMKQKQVKTHIQPESARMEEEYSRETKEEKPVFEKPQQEGPDFKIDPYKIKSFAYDVPQQGAEAAHEDPQMPLLSEMIRKKAQVTDTAETGTQKHETQGPQDAQDTMEKVLQSAATQDITDRIRRAASGDEPKETTAEKGEDVVKTILELSEIVSREASAGAGKEASSAVHPEEAEILPGDHKTAAATEEKKKIEKESGQLREVSRKSKRSAGTSSAESLLFGAPLTTGWLSGSGSNSLFSVIGADGALEGSTGIMHVPGYESEPAMFGNMNVLKYVAYAVDTGQEKQNEQKPLLKASNTGTHITSEIHDISRLDKTFDGGVSFRDGGDSTGKRDTEDRTTKIIETATARKVQDGQGTGKILSGAGKVIERQKTYKVEKEAAQVKLESESKKAVEKDQAALAPKAVQGEMESIIKKKLKKDDWAGEDVAASLITLLMKTADEETYDHSRRVVNLAELLAGELGIVDPGEIKTVKDSALFHDIGSIEIIIAGSSRRAKSEFYDSIENIDLAKAASLHDIGLVKIPKSILTKSGSLTPEEEKIMKRHPVIGEEIVRPIPSLRHIAPIIRHHHEQWDGKGYPDGLSGEKIPFEARLISVADAYDSMLSDRADRKGVTPLEAREALIKGAGKQFDPSIVSAFLRVLDNMEK
ncbi:MAG: HD domain-containing protein [Chloroflexi bacterium]|nr:HD domain-containing protein [Chloroflexota bacterium]